MNITRLTVIAACTALAFTAAAQSRRPTQGAKLHRFSSTVERERPELNEETKALISAYRRDPSETNRAALEKQVRANYEKVMARKRAKLEELNRTAGPEKVKEMQEIVDEMVVGRETRIQQSMARFTDRRLGPYAREAKDGFHPVLGAPRVSISHTPVTVAEYAKFCAATGRNAPAVTEAKLPVTQVSLADAEAYCKWLSKKDGATYRLPTAEEWELAAGHMPKDADFNSKGECDGLSPVDSFSSTLGACGAIDFWGNVWEWTSTRKGSNALVKGGAWDSPRTRCRTEIRDESRPVAKGLANVGFRVVKVSESEDPEVAHGHRHKGGSRGGNRHLDEDRRGESR